MAGSLRVRRSRGALSGVLLVLLGIWGALIPFIGPYFHYAYLPDRAWTSTSGRIWLEVLPGAVTLVGGLIVLVSRFRPAGLLGAWLAALAGAWFAIGGLLGGHFSGIPGPGAPAGGATRAVFEQLGFFTGLGVVIVFLAALALGRFTVVAAKDAAALAAAAEMEPETGTAATESPAPRRVRRRAASVPADTAADTDPGTGRTARRGGVVRPVPVFRGRQRTAEQEAADEDADNAGATTAGASRST